MHINKQKIMLYISIILLIFNIPLNAYASDIMFYNITTKNGLSQNTAKAIFQDSKGYIWIGTTDGLNKYNGYHFKIYNKGFSENEKIISGYISCLNEDLDNNLWVGTNDGLSKINLETDEITNYSINNSSILSNKIRDIKIAKNGNVIIATQIGLNIYSKENDDFINISPKDEIYSNINIISTETYDNDIYVLSSNKFFKQDLDNGTCTELTNDILNNIAENDTFTDISIYEDSIYFGTVSKGLYVYNIKTGDTKKLCDIPPINNDTNSDVVNYIFNDKTNIWIGTNNGLYLYNENTKEMKYYNESSSINYSLVNNDIQCIMKDSSGLLWVGTYLGVSTFDYNKGIRYFNSTEINSNIFVGLYEDISGKRWYGSNGSGLSIYDPSNFSLSHINTKTKNKLSSNYIWDLTGNDKYIFAATEQGVNIIDRETLEVKVIRDELNDPYCYTLYLDDNHLWVGTICGFNIINLTDYSVKSMNNLFKNNNISVRLGGDIYKDSEGIFWLGTANKDGLIRYDPTDDSLRLFKYDGTKNSISDNTILSITEDDEGNLWFGTESGLNLYNRYTDEFTIYSTEDGLSNNTIYSITPYNDNIWISTNSGIDCLTFENNEIVNVKKYVRGTEFNSNSSLLTKNGEIVLGATDGIYFLNPDLIENRNYTPKLRFDDIKLNGSSINDLNNSSIHYKDNSIYIELSTSIYGNSQNKMFYYRINNGDWILLSDNDITFSNLASGQYNIDFKVENHNANISTTESISFTVKTPFWKNPFVITFNFLFLAVLLVYLSLKIKYMRNDILLKNNYLAKEMNEKNKLLLKNIELEKRKNIYFINMSHELRTPLNVISSVQQLILSLSKNGPIPPNELNKYLKMSGSNINRLLTIINDLIDSTKMDEGIYKLSPEKKDIIYVIEEAALSLKNIIEQKDIELIIDTELEECIMKFDENAIERCIVNIVGNAFKFTESGGSIYVNIYDLNDSIKIEIKDTGCGINSKDIDNIFDRFNQSINSKREISEGSGLGLTITKQLIALHNGNISVQSEIGKGTTFTIILPK